MGFLLLHWGLGGSDLYAQKALQRRMGTPRDSIKSVVKDSLLTDSLTKRNEQELKLMEAPIDTTVLAFKVDSIQKEFPQPKQRFIPNSNRSVWLALVFPGGGQIYNRKYWKLPIVYGGFVGCTYALNWNNKMYKDYSQAYLDIMDDDPNTKSYEDFLPINASIAGQEDRFKEIFRKRKDIYRRQRDLSIFCFIGVYLLSVIDAYVDAELSDFDITKDLGLRVEPALFNDGKSKNFSSVGLQCSLKF
ncbi:MAG: hypothetical protein IKU64_02930 [Bacteroides sp.]|nr:hypothetical protein [Bacteroides sp.]